MARIGGALVSAGQMFDAVANAPDEMTRMELQITHAELTAAIAKFTDNPTAVNLRKLNGHWAHAAHVMAFAARKRRAKA